MTDEKTILSISMITVLAMLAGCAGNMGPALSATAVTQQPAAATDEPPNSSPDENGYDPDDYEDSIAPQPTPWPEPKESGYTGQYMDIALDRDPSRYPALAVNQVVETTWGALKIPEGWSVADADGPQPTLVDGNNRAVGSVFMLKCIPSEPYFALKNENDTLIVWEKPDYPAEARALTLESDAPSMALESNKTIMRLVCVITDGPIFDDDDSGYYFALCLNVDKAYVGADGAIEYVISNKDIDAMAMSMMDGLE